MVSWPNLSSIISDKQYEADMFLAWRLGMAAATGHSTKLIYYILTIEFCFLLTKKTNGQSKFLLLKKDEIENIQVRKKTYIHFYNKH